MAMNCVYCNRRTYLYDFVSPTEAAADGRLSLQRGCIELLPGSELTSNGVTSSSKLLTDFDFLTSHVIITD